MTLTAQPFADLLAAIGARTPAPASGVATAYTAALAAALVELAARFANDDGKAERAQALAARLVDLADEDVVAYSAFLTDRSTEARAAIVRIPEEIAACAEEVAMLADDLRAKLTSAVAADAAAAAGLARAAAGVARGLAEVNA